MNIIENFTEIDGEFCNFLQQQNLELYQILQNKRLLEEEFSSDEIIGLSKQLDDFLLDKFNINEQNTALIKKYEPAKLMAWMKRNVIVRIASKKYAEQCEQYSVLINTSTLQNEHGVIEPQQAKYFDESFVLLLKLAMQNEFFGEDGNINRDCATALFNLTANNSKITTNEQLYETLLKYSAYASLSYKGRQVRHLHSCFFAIPQKIDARRQFNFAEESGCISTPQHKKYQRVNFAFFDQKPSAEQILWQTKHCIYCHRQQNDFCRKGYDEQNEGCPLDQKISEMNFTKSNCYTIAPVAIAMIDNPLVLLTGRRICNDCVKSCIYQKTDAVDTPSIETASVDDMLALPNSLEIYNLLTMWNPLKATNYLPSPPPNNKSVLVVGAGPAGLAASHYLTHQGFSVSLIDGLKIEPIDINNIDASKILSKNLDERINDAFGGVMSYGITPRWNKNLLDLVKVALCRRKNFSMQGGVRFSLERNDEGAITPQKASELGFNHICLANGAGKPRLASNIEGLDTIKGGLITSSNFLMSMQSSHGFIGKNKNIINLQSPVLVLGAGLTATDCATEALAFLHKHGEDKPCVKIIYHSAVQSSSSYRTNYEELEQALHQGVQFLQNTSVSKINTDADGFVEGVYCGDGAFIEAKTIITAFGTENNGAMRACKNNNYISILGDANPAYEGSVVKALASAKNSMGDILAKINQNQRSGGGALPNLTTKVVDCNKIDGEIYKITIKTGAISFYNLLALDICKLQALGTQNKPFAITIASVDVKNNTASFYLQKSGEQTSGLIENHGANYICMPSGQRFNFEGYKQIAAIASKNSPRALALQDSGYFADIHYPQNQDDFYTTYTNLLQKLSTSDLIYIASNNFEAQEGDFEFNNANTLQQLRKIKTQCEGGAKNNDVNNYAMNSLKTSNSSVSVPQKAGSTTDGNLDKTINGLKASNISVDLHQKAHLAAIDTNGKQNTLPHPKTAYFFNAKMQCMLKGICSKCLILTPERQIYTCKEPFVIF